MRKARTKLALRRETLVQLRSIELRRAVGGRVDTEPGDHCVTLLALVAETEGAAG